MTSTLLKIGQSLKPTRAPFWPLYRKFLQSTDWPILVGPWRSELGFEALYWIPFVHALGIDPKRLIPITRGGAAALYGTPSGFELYAMREPKQVRIENIVQHAKTGLLKQTSVTAFDRQIIKDAAKMIGLKRYHVLHPAWMYQTLSPYWEGDKGLDWVWPSLMRREPGTKKAYAIKNLNVPPLPEGLELPKQFVAVRFYYRSTFPPNEQTMTCAKESIKQLASLSPVVLLNPGVHADEHIDVDVKGIPNVYRLGDLCTVTPENNLAIQAAVIAKAQGFVGTYGGLAQLALRLGKPTISYYQKWEGTSLGHKYLADAMATAMQVACLVLRVGEVPLLRSVLPHLVAQRPLDGQKPAFVPRPQPPEEAA